MKIKRGQEVNFKQYKEVNSKDPESNAVIKYMRRWARMMEWEIRRGKRVHEIASRTAVDANVENLTGFMHSCAVTALIKYWEYGEELKTWRNRTCLYI